MRMPPAIAKQHLVAQPDGTFPGARFLFKVETAAVPGNGVAVVGMIYAEDGNHARLVERSGVEPKMDSYVVQPHQLRQMAQILLTTADQLDAAKANAN